MCFMLLCYFATWTSYFNSSKNCMKIHGCYFNVMYCHIRLALLSLIHTTGFVEIQEQTSCINKSIPKTCPQTTWTMNIHDSLRIIQQQNKRRQNKIHIFSKTKEVAWKVIRQKTTGARATSQRAQNTNRDSQTIHCPVYISDSIETIDHWFEDVNSWHPDKMYKNNIKYLALTFCTNESIFFQNFMFSSVEMTGEMRLATVYLISMISSLFLCNVVRSLISSMAHIRTTLVYSSGSMQPNASTILSKHQQYFPSINHTS